MNNIRVRFAPSPTGPLHIGGIRTALFNFLFAKKHKGIFILRIEDTDQNRYVENAEKYIIDALNWCGIPFDEGVNKNEIFAPYRQSERKDIYAKYVQKLIDSDNAYYAFDTSEELDFHRKDHEKKDKTFIYNWHNRNKGRLKNSLDMSKEEIEAKIRKGDKYVVRFKSPSEKILKMHDLIRGEIKIDTNILDDKILFKSDGMPTYHLANIVDDHLMEISHVIRGEEWLPSMALHVLLYEAFGWKIPEFAHLPLILKPNGKGKLSKRDGDKLGFPVFPLAYENPKTGEMSRGYREDGYFPEAVINFLAFLGWNPGTEQEIFSLEALVNAFDLKQVNKSGARFDPDKTRWFNQQYLQLKTDAELAELFIPTLNKKFKDSSYFINKIYENDHSYITKVVGLIKERATFVKDFWDLGFFFFEAPTTYDTKAVKKQWKENTSQIMTNLTSLLSTIDNFSPKNIEIVVKEWIMEKELGFGKVMPPFRLALVGALKGPNIFEISAVIGKEETINRIRTAINLLST
jgi:glutamyl-tRNA synthetase